nr:hypothetical protein [Spirochaetota bacterium]
LNPKNDNCYIKIGFCVINNILNTDFFKPKNSLLNRISLINNIRLFDIAYNINNSENNIFMKIEYLKKLGILNKKYYNKAINIINNLINIDDKNDKYYKLRAEIYSELEKKDLSLIDINKCLELNPIPEYYFLKGSILFFSYNRDLGEKCVDNIKKAIELDKYNTSYYYKLGCYYLWHDDYDSAIEVFNKVEVIDKNNDDLFDQRAICYHFLKDYEKEVFDLLNIRNKREVFDLNSRIAQCYLNLNNFEKAIKYFSYDINDNIKLPFLEKKKNNLSSSFAIRGLCYLMLGNEEKAKIDFNKSGIFKKKGNKFTICDDFKFIKEILLNLLLNKDLIKSLNILKYLFFNDISSFFSIEKIIDFAETIENYIKSDNFSSDKLSELLKNQKFVDLNKNYLPQIYPLKNNLFINIDDLFHKKEYIDIFFIDFENKIIQFIINHFYSKNSDILKILKDISIEMSGFIQNKYISLVKQKEKEKYEAIIRERDKVIADLSHSIKNLIATVKDPLENLRSEAKEYTKTIDNAINGTNLIRGIVNAMNLSYVGSIEDFYEDAKSEDDNKIAVKDIMINAIISAVPNMFDKKYFNDFQKRYFPTREIFIEATTEWQKVSQKKEPKEIVDYLNKYMFDIKLDFVNIDGLALSDKKGSVVKMMILLQEMILNAIKYSSFIERDRRIVNIRLEKSDKIKFEIENRYKKDIVTKKSGLGHVIINNFAKLLKTEPLITNNDDIFKIELNIPDLWR